MKSLVEKIVADAKRKNFLILAKENVQRELRCWLEGYWTPMLEAAVVFLINDYGVDAWIDDHPWVKHAPEQPLHAASYRTYDLERYYQVMRLRIAGKELYIFPEDGSRLFAEVRQKIWKEESQ